MIVRHKLLSRGGFANRFSEALQSLGSCQKKNRVPLRFAERVRRFYEDEGLRIDTNRELEDTDPMAYRAHFLERD
jgi:hypothetical protein